MIGEADRGGRALFPPSISEILPEEHIARFFVRVVEGLDLSKLKAEYSPNLGRTGYAPAVLLTLWIYGYVKGVSSSRKLEEATWLNLDFMYIANGEHPDHTTLSNFRKNHQDAFKHAAQQVLQVAVEAGVLDMRGLAVDGTKLKAYASREKHMTSKSARKRIKAYRELVEKLMAESDQQEEADSAAGDATRSSSDVVDPSLVERLIADVEKLERLADQLDAEDQLELAKEQARYDEMNEKREAHKRDNGSYPTGRPPKPPGDKPKHVAREHLTDPEANLMKTRDGIMPAYNGQAGVDIDTQLIVTSDVTTDANDMHQIQPVLDALDTLPEGALASESDEEEDVARVNLLADAGYCSADNVEACETANVDAYIPSGRNGETEEPKTVESEAVTQMVERMKTDDGQALYRRRKSTVETTFGCIKHAMGFRYLKLRGLHGAQTEWQLVCLAWNLKRLFNLRGMSLC